ncbi:MAG: hypothetical protein J7641_21340 [Cyanobacteria bacterium SID2]|nr:hypothetical protein [Cyanobacteria bacterium SID2]
MQSNIIVNNITKSQTNKIELTLNIDGKIYLYDVDILDEKGILSASFKGELQDILSKDIQKNRFILQVIFDCYKGKSIDLPLDLGKF